MARGKIIRVEGYKAFRGYMKITPLNKAYLPHTVYGDWLYRPDTDCWYCKGLSYPASVCTIEVIE